LVQPDSRRPYYAYQVCRPFVSFVTFVSFISERSDPKGQIRKIRSKFPPKIFSLTSVLAPISSSAEDCCSYTSLTHPRGKNDESVPNSRRSGPTTASA